MIFSVVPLIPPSFITVSPAYELESICKSNIPFPVFTKSLFPNISPVNIASAPTTSIFTSFLSVPIISFANLTSFSLFIINFPPAIYIVFSLIPVSAAISIAPPVIVVVPVYELSPLNVTVPSPSFTIFPAPIIVAAISASSSSVNLNTVPSPVIVILSFIFKSAASVINDEPSATVIASAVIKLSLSFSKSPPVISISFCVIFA